MYSKLPNLVIGFHGCDKETFDDVLHNHKPMKNSENEYDWLGNGIYFWEQSFDRALDWAKRNKKIKNPAVIGAVIDLGYCLNLMDYHSSDILRKGYKSLKAHHESLNIKIPENKNVSGNSDLLLRNLDCAVIQQIHDMHKNIFKIPVYDSVRGAFIEGGEVYPNSGFREKTHIQICVINPNCIKGYFSPQEYNGKYSLP